MGEGGDMRAKEMQTEADRGPLPLADNEWLAAVATGRLDIAGLVGVEMANRGLGPEGNWVGFEAAGELLRKRDNQRGSAVEAAARALGFETLDPRNSDRLDFREVSCSAVREALENAYAAGRRAGVARIAERSKQRDQGIAR